MESQNTRGNSSFNGSFVSDTNILTLRLDTSPLIKDIEVFLRGTRLEKVNDEKGVTSFQQIEVGKPLMNSEGVQAIINYLRLTLSPHTVQGNFTDSDYRFFVAEMDNNLSCNTMINLDRWDIDENDYDHINDSIISSVQLFVSRLIDNKERDSYNATMRSVESNTINEGNKGFLGIGRG